LNSLGRRNWLNSGGVRTSRRVALSHPAMALSPDKLRSMVRPTSVHRRLYIDPEVFDLERERIFRVAWLYVGHESQARLPGDFFTTELAGQPVVMVRHSDHSVRVLFNRCAHRGAKVVVEPSGQARTFVCCYHGWTFATDGRLLHAPAHEGARAADFDLADPAFSMASLPRVDSYRGFVFASFASAGPGLREYLGQAAAQIDNMVDRAPGGEIEVAGGCLKILQRSNWKIHLENTQDGLHAGTAHRSSIGASRVQASNAADAPFALKVIMANGRSREEMDRLRVTALDWGHSFMAGFRETASREPWYDAYIAALISAKGERESERILSVNTHNAIFYPNASVQPGFMQMRVIFPLAVDRTRVETWSLRMKGAPEELFQRTLAYANVIHSPSSLIRPDDIEAYERIQEGLHAEGLDWISLHRDFGRETKVEGGLQASALADLAMRNQFRAWTRFMADETGHE
jgi:phenylpropionate dioxygenase-like ring-hydroxylating dioxygenase large terminal subunit